MNEEWAAQVVGRLFRIEQSHKSFAARCGYSPAYFSMLLNGKKHFETEYAKRQTVKRIIKALEEAEREAFNAR